MIFSGCSNSPNGLISCALPGNIFKTNDNNPARCGWPIPGRLHRLHDGGRQHDAALCPGYRQTALDDEKWDTAHTEVADLVSQ